MWWLSHCVKILIIVYIISVLLKRRNLTLSYLVICSLMLGRTNWNYSDLFVASKGDIRNRFSKATWNFTSYIWLQKCNFHTLVENFSRNKNFSCRVDCLRGWRRKALEIFGQVPFLSDKKLIEYGRFYEVYYLYRAIFSKKA